MYTSQSNMTTPNWGDFWLILVGRDGQTYLVEHIGFATLVQVQLLLENGTLPTDVVPGYGALGASRTRADGVWGAQTLRQLYAYVNENAAAIGLSPGFKQTVLGSIASDMRQQRISSTTIYAAFVLCYLRPRAVRRRTDLGVQSAVLPAQVSVAAGSGEGIITAGENPRFISFLQRLPFPATDPQVVSVLPRIVRMDASFPPPPSDVAALAAQSGFTIPGSNPNAPPGPYTLRQGESSPIALPGGSTAPRTAPSIGQPVDGPPPPVSVPTPPPPPPGSSQDPYKPPQEILVPTSTVQPGQPAPPSPQPSDPSSPPADVGSTVPGVIATSLSTVDRYLPSIAAATLGLGALAFVGALIADDMQKKPAQRAVPRPVVRTGTTRIVRR